MTPRTALVVDDEMFSRNELRHLLSAFPQDITVIGEAADGISAVDATRHLKPNVVFLDVQMPGMNGFEVWEALNRESGMNLPQVIFVTAFEEFACKAFEINAVDYLLKPLESARIEKTIRRLGSFASGRPMAKQSASYITVRKGHRIILKEPAQILYAEINDGLVSVVDTEGVFLAPHRTLEDLAEDLGEPPFFRAHRGFLLNLKYLAEIIPVHGGLFTLLMKPCLSAAVLAQTRAQGNERGQPMIPLSRSQARKLRRLMDF